MKITNPCRVYKICFIKILRAFNVKIKAKYIKVMHCKNRNFFWVFITLKFRYFFPVILGETQQGIFNAAPHEDTGNRSNQRAFNHCGLHCKDNHFLKINAFRRKAFIYCCEFRCEMRPSITHNYCLLLKYKSKKALTKSWDPTMQ